MTAQSVDRLFGVLAEHRYSTALTGHELDISYAELIESASKIGDDLSISGNISDRRSVLICAPRCRPSTIVLLLAAWRCGMVPFLVDDQVPRQRLDTALRIAKPAAILRRAVSGQDCSWRVLGDSWTLSLAVNNAKINPLDSCPDPAYIAMTSGSTSDQRFVLCRWTGLDIVAPQWAKRAGIDNSSRLLQISSPAYDAFYTEVVPTLSAGGTLVFGAAGLWSRPNRLVGYIRKSETTHLTVPPSYLSRLLATHRMPHVKTLSTAGERLGRELAMQARHHADTLLNAYGPAEATVCAMTHEVTGDEDEIPLGRPLAGVSADIFGGVIRITGPTVAWGYLNDGNGAQRFGTPDSHSYLTGDLGEVRNGMFYFLGRADRQVKVHGHRVDLSSIELNVRRVAGVTDCAVFYSGSQVSCLISATRPVSEVAKEVRALIPPAEWPSRWAKVSSIRYLESDKLDLRWAREALDSSKHDIAAHGALSNIPPAVVNAWRQHATVIGENTDFFTSGGDSLSAMELLENIYDETGIEIDLADFLTAPTLLNLADAIQSHS